ncbi:DNA polymerase III subunit gamma/tau [Methylosoma difficile]
MSYQVLARKWRPHYFNHVVGQDHVVKSLQNALQHNRLHHAYLFTGTRGVGKTTLARILAKAINCENLQDFNPCGQCAICVAFDEGRFLDLVEVDAASRTKVEDTRDLLDNAQYAPNQGRYKVYLIDEVHMLSGHSFNALLKTLEEPPAHVKFLLATTDPQKLPVTVLSRCLQLNLKSLSPAQIFQQFEYILKEESIVAESLALKVLARAAAGSMRDGLSLLDQAIVFGNGQVTADDVNAMLGTVAQQPVENLLTALTQADAKTILDNIAELADTAVDFGAVLQQLLVVLHRVALVQQVPGAIADDFDKDTIEALAGRLSPEDVQLFYQIGLMGQKDLDLAPEPRMGFEMVMLRMLAFKPATVEAVAKSPKPSYPVNNTPTEAPAVKQPTSSPQPPPKIAESTPPPPAAAALPVREASVKTMDNWQTMIENMGLTGLARELANHCVLQHIDDHVCKLVIDPGHIRSPRSENTLQEALQKYRGSPLKLQIDTQTNIADATPAAQIAKAREDRQQAAVDAIQTDPNIQALKEHFDARIIPGTITPV